MGDAIETWREKREHLERDLAIASDSGQKFSIKKQIEETKGEIARLESEVGTGDVQMLQSLTGRNISALKEHTILRFGEGPDNAIHLKRATELEALYAAIQNGSLLLTGEPGCGKSGIISVLVQKILKNGDSVVLLLAEDLFEDSFIAPVPGLKLPIEDVLANWNIPGRRYLITDALDALRDGLKEKAMRRALERVKSRATEWTVIASVREFELKGSEELRQLFPGAGTPGYASAEFAKVAHFHLQGLSGEDLEQLSQRRPAMRHFLESACQSQKAGDLHRSPFYLKLIAELSQDIDESSPFPAWESQAHILRLFWNKRVLDNGRSPRESALAKICGKMVASLRMQTSATALGLDCTERAAVEDLRKRGVLTPPRLISGGSVGDDRISFRHHLLHDHAIAQHTVPREFAAFVDFTDENPLFPVLYRISYMMALEELWDMDEPQQFWECARQIEGIPFLRAVVRMLPSVLAARRFTLLGELEPLLNSVRLENDMESPTHKALRHLVGGLQDFNATVTGQAIVRARAEAWSAFAEKLSGLLSANPNVYWPVLFVLDELKKTVFAAGQAAVAPPVMKALNATGRGLLAEHVSKPVSNARGYMARVAVEVVCKTLPAAIQESIASLSSLLVEDRVAQFPHDDVDALADHLGCLVAAGDNPAVFSLVVRLCEVAFRSLPEGDEHVTLGGRIMPMHFRKRDLWHGGQYSIAQGYEAISDGFASVMAAIAVVAYNAGPELLREARNVDFSAGVNVVFRGTTVRVPASQYLLLDSDFTDDRGRIAIRFTRFLKQCAVLGREADMDAILSVIGTESRSPRLWRILMEVGAEYPETLGSKLDDLLFVPALYLESDYSEAMIELFGARHRTGDRSIRERLERIAIDLPVSGRETEGDNWERVEGWVYRRQHRLWATINFENAVFRKTREAIAAIPPEAKEPVPKPGFTVSEWVPPNSDDSRDSIIVSALRPYLFRDNRPQLTSDDVEPLWEIIDGHKNIGRLGKDEREGNMAEDWGYFVSAVEKVIRHCSWPPEEGRWAFCREVMLLASRDRVPTAAQVRDDDHLAWSFPAPRIDAAQSLPIIVFSTRVLDEDIRFAIQFLRADPSMPLRANLAEVLWGLCRADAEFAWEQVDFFIENEKSAVILVQLTHSLRRMARSDWEVAKARVARLYARASLEIAPAHPLHERIASIYLERYLNQNDTECFTILNDLIAECDSERSKGALDGQLHFSRNVLVAGSADQPDAKADGIRKRAFVFYEALLDSAQEKLVSLRASLQTTHDSFGSESAQLELLQISIQRCFELVDGIAAQLYFASGAFDSKRNPSLHDADHPLTEAQSARFWREAFPLLSKLANEIHPHVAHELLGTLIHLVHHNPKEAFLMAARALKTASAAGAQFESIMVTDAVKLIDVILADHKEVFFEDGKPESTCLTGLLDILDLFVDVGWPDARRLAYRLEDVLR